MFSDATVVAAARKFVCARLATYENAEEAKVLSSYFRGRSGKLENTVVVLVAPDGKTAISRGGRGPQHISEGRRGRRGPPQGASGGSGDAAKAFAQALEKASARYTPTAAPSTLPLSLDFRRALNVAACDQQPLVVAYASTKAKREAMTKKLAALAWSETYMGRFHYAVVESRDDLDDVDGVPSGDTYCVIAPGTYGIDGDVIAKAKASATSDKVEAMLKQADAKMPAPKDRDIRQHVRAAQRQGIKWETEVPVTDPGVPPGGRGR